jgi:hypothetical protein
LANLDFCRAALRQWMTPFFTALSMTDAASGNAFPAWAESAAEVTFFVTALTSDLTALFAALRVLSCRMRFIALL